jgi:hypothetical protein
VPSFYHKQLAQEAVNKIEGLVQVVNEIEVVVPPSHRTASRQGESGLLRSFPFVTNDRRVALPVFCHRASRRAVVQSPE